MSGMLEQAILDANELREAALKGAESSILEKYSEEVKSAVETILEQEPEEDPMVSGDPEVVAGEEDIVGDIPAAHVASEGDEEIVVVDLDDIIAAAEAEDEQDGGLDREEIAQEVGIDLNIEDPEQSPANRSEIEDDIEINESDLVDIFQEMLKIDIDPEDIAEAADMNNEDEEATDEEVVNITPSQTTGMEKEDIEALTKKLERFEDLTLENSRYKDLLNKAKTTLEEINLQNARLLYANRVLRDPSLNERQKDKIAELVSSARSVEEARTVFETLQKTVQSGKKSAPQSLSEAVTRKSSVVLSGNRKDQSTAEKAPAYNRWAMLAGLEK